MLRSLRCCLNPKVVGALAVTALVIWVVVPSSGSAALPLLVTLVCPLSMGLMMWQMRRSHGETSPPAAGPPRPASDAHEGEVAALREELAVERARTQLSNEDGRRPA